MRKGRFKHIETPKGDVVALHHQVLNMFELDQVHEWNPENIRKYKLYIKRFPNEAVMLNLMQLDK